MHGRFPDTCTELRGHNHGCNSFLLSPLPNASFSVPIPMLPIQTLDQAHRSHRAAWDIQLPPSSLHSTLTRHTGTELHLNKVNALLLRLQDWPCCCLPGTWLWAARMYCNCCIFKMSDSQVPLLFHRLGVVAPSDCTHLWN